MAVAAATPALANDARFAADTPPWRTAYHDATLTVKIDTSATKKTPDGFYRAHLRWEYAEDQKIEHGAYRAMVEDRLLDCKKVQSKPLNASAYDANNKVVSSFTTPDDEVQYLNWSQRKEGTRSDKAYTAICATLASSKAKAAVKKTATTAAKKSSAKKK
jgi:hypothetical protein